MDPVVDPVVENLQAVPAPQDAAVPAPQDTAVPAPQDAVVPLPQDAAVPAPQDAVVPLPQDAAVPALQDAAVPAPPDAAVPALQDAAVPALQDAAVPVAGPPGDYVFNCPHCQMLVQVPRDGLNCQIFRHGVLKSNPDVQVPPHAPQAECEQLVANGLIYGCGKPFIYRGGDTAEICGYI